MHRIGLRGQVCRARPTWPPGPALRPPVRAPAVRVGTTLTDRDVTRVDFRGRPFRLWVGADEYRADAVIVATGASALGLGVPSEAQSRGRGARGTCARCRRWGSRRVQTEWGDWWSSRAK